MKKFVIFALIFVLALSMCACSSEKTTPAPAIPEYVETANPMFVDIGTTVVIDGVEWSAATMFFNTNTDSIVCNTNNSYFTVNRVNMHIYYVYSSHGQSGVAYAFDTGLIYEGTLYVDGTNTPVPTN